MKNNEKITTKKGLEKDWEKSVDKNQDGYGHGVIEVVVKVCKLLDEGKTPKKAEQEGIKNSDITGYMAGAMASMISHFHPRGDEFKEYWNKQFDPKPRKGVINPALMTITNKPTKTQLNKSIMSKNYNILKLTFKALDDIQKQENRIKKHAYHKDDKVREKLEQELLFSIGHLKYYFEAIIFEILEEDYIKI